MKQIETLRDDIMEVIRGGGGWDATVTKFFADNVTETVHSRLVEGQTPRSHLSLSQIGGPQRKLWYKFNEPHIQEEMSAKSLGTFLFGDLLEQLVVSLVMAAGHSVDGLQEEIDVCGVVGHGDIIIDGWVFDIKSANGRNFPKFEYNQLKGYEKKTKDGPKWIPPEEVDSYGYISQLSSYLYGYRNDKRVHVKDKAGFLAINKEVFDIAVDIYDLKEEVENKPQEIKAAQDMLAGPIPPRCFSDVKDGESGNRVLKWQCGYCYRRDSCWPDLRTFAYSSGPKYFTKVVREPKVPEIK